jgi:hypothetical protein
MDWKKVFTPPFLAAAALLLLALAGFYTALLATDTHLLKARLEPRHRLYMLPADVARYHKLNDEALSKEMAEELGAADFITSVYQDLGGPRADGGSIRLHVAYHTGEPDSVPHIPDRCALAGESTRGSTTAVKIALDSPRIYRTRDEKIMAKPEAGNDVRLPASEFAVNVFHYKPEGGTQPAAVFYFFLCNGRLLTRDAEVQRVYTEPRTRASYWCRVEVQVPGVEDPQAQQAAVARFLSAMLPEIAASLPEWDGSGAPSAADRASIPR